jgi:hypothetical protein
MSAVRYGNSDIEISGRYLRRVKWSAGAVDFGVATLLIDGTSAVATTNAGMIIRKASAYAIVDVSG